MAGELKFSVNERLSTVTAAAAPPLLYVLSNELSLRGPRFGCGLGQCGSCSVLVNGVEIHSCLTPVSAVEGKAVTTLKGLPAWYARQKRLASVPALHPVQQAMIDEQAVQCGSYPILRFEECPEVTAVVVQRLNESSTGARRRSHGGGSGSDCKRIF